MPSSLNVLYLSNGEGETTVGYASLSCLHQMVRWKLFELANLYVTVKRNI